MIIKNREKLATTETRRAALDIIEAGISRVLPSSIMKFAVSFDRKERILTVMGDVYPVSKGRIFVIGGGKAAGLMADSLEAIVGPDNISVGVVTCKSDKCKTGKIQVLQAGHPVPDERGVRAVQKMLQLKERYDINRHDLVLCLISGGGSALLPTPAEGTNLQDIQKVTELLLASGAEITEINIVRKHISKIKGGRLGYFFAPATVISLILSDVVGNDLSTIASGPTYPDSSSYSDAYGVLKKYNLLSKTPNSILDLLKEGGRGQVEETPKSLNNCRNYIIGDVTLAVKAMSQRATEIGLKPKIISVEQTGDTAVAAIATARKTIEKTNEAYNVLLLGGETTLQLPDRPGKGGRNQHYALVSTLAMKDYPGEWTVASVGTDGSDYLPDVAGAIVDNASLGRLGGEAAVQQVIGNYDSYTLLKQAGESLIETGDTGTNVGDINVYVLNKAHVS